MNTYRNRNGRKIEERGYRLDGTPVKRTNLDKHVCVIRGHLSGDLKLNLRDTTVPVTVVYLPGGRKEIVGASTLLCMPDFTVNGADATDEQIVRALVGDQSIYE